MCIIAHLWPGGVMVWALDLRLSGHGFDPQPFRFQVATLGEFLAHVSLSPSSIILQWFVHLQARGLRKGDEHPAYTLHGVRHTLPLTLLSAKVTRYQSASGHCTSTPMVAFNWQGKTSCQSFILIFCPRGTVVEL